MKRAIIALALATFVSLGAVSGSFASYQTELKTGTNTINAAKFSLSGKNLDAKGTQSFTFPCDNYAVAPGSSGTVYFTVTNGNSSVGIDYIIKLYRNSKLKNLQFKLYEEGSVGWNPIGLTDVTNGDLKGDLQLTQTADSLASFGATTYQTNEYKLDWTWPSSADDISYQGKSEKFMIDVTGTSVLGNDFAYVSGTIFNGIYSKSYDGVYAIFKSSTGVYTVDLSPDCTVSINPLNNSVTIDTGNNVYTLTLQNKDFRAADGSFAFSGTYQGGGSAGLNIYFSKLGNLAG